MPDRIPTGQRLKARIQELEEKVKMQEQQIEKSTRAHPGSSSFPEDTTSNIVNSTRPSPAIERNPALSLDFLMSR